MAQKRQLKEPLLSSVAGKLGHVAGTLTHAAQEWTQNLAPTPDGAPAKPKAGTRENNSAGRNTKGRPSTRKMKSATTAARTKRRPSAPNADGRRKRGAKG